MNRPSLEMADLVRSAGQNCIERNRAWWNRLHLKVLTAIERCRTAALGGHLDECGRCGHRAISFNSCRNRHCPKCQANARDRWLEARQRELLPTRYVHVVFTLPHELAPLALQNKRVVYDLLFRISAETLLAIAREPRHLGADIGFFSVLHSWNQKLEHHPHIHCVVPAGGLSPDRTRWIQCQRKFFLPVGVLAEVFRGKFTQALQEAFARGELGFHGSLKPLGRPKVFSQLLRQTFRQKWVVYAKRPFGGPEQALRYLGCYTHRVAISNHRLVSFADDQVTFRWRDSAHHNRQRLMTLHVNEFLRRFLLHVLPPGFVRIRHFGFLSTRKRSTFLPLCLRLLGTAAAVPEAAVTGTGRSSHPPATWLCPHCQGPMQILERWTASQLRFRSPPHHHATVA
ncbi:MAG: IS91 family transposase [Acidobacteriaceae bacterium]|nr:IS91 family transposase [Acidobacteriaceae bacterium]